jgi:hypothetical protein
MSVNGKAEKQFGMLKFEAMGGAQQHEISMRHALYFPLAARLADESACAMRLHQDTMIAKSDSDGLPMKRAHHVAKLAAHTDQRVVILQHGLNEERTEGIGDGDGVVMNGTSMPGHECPKIVGIAYCYPFMSQ